MDDWSGDWDESYQIEAEALEEEMRIEERMLTPRGIAKSNAGMLMAYRKFRRAADAVVDVWRHHPDVVAISLIGSVVRSPWKEVPRFSPYRRKRIKIWHECMQVDLALWLSGLGDLGGLRKAKDRQLRTVRDDLGGGVASHQLDALILEPGTDRYLGWLCKFNRCPKRGKIACLVPGCGDSKFLRQFSRFRWRPKRFAKDGCFRLYERSAGILRRAELLPLPDNGESVDPRALR